MQCTTFAYDGLGRLTNETETVPIGARGRTTAQTVRKSYTFDTAGNRRTMTVATTGGVNPANYTVVYAYDGNNRLQTETRTPTTGAATVTTYLYDANGNQTRRQGPEGIETRTYDVFNRLRGVTLGNATTTYLYRPDGLRLSKASAGQTTMHVCDGANIVEELNASGGMISRFARGVNLISILDFQGERYYLFNANGDVVQLAGVNGNVVRNYYYDAFGNETNPAPNDRNPFRYKGDLGYYWDAEAGTYYLQMRHYNPFTSRMTSPDPYWNISNMIYGSNPIQSTLGVLMPNIWAIRESGNLYVYAKSNPLRYWDPTEHSAVRITALNAPLGHPLYAPGATNTNFPGGGPFPVGHPFHVPPSNSGPAPVAPQPRGGGSGGTLNNSGTIGTAVMGNNATVNNTGTILSLYMGNSATVPP